jgi:hypothetical protein
MSLAKEIELDAMNQGVEAFLRHGRFIPAKVSAALGAELENIHRSVKDIDERLENLSCHLREDDVAIQVAIEGDAKLKGTIPFDKASYRILLENRKNDLQYTGGALYAAQKHFNLLVKERLQTLE